MFKDIETPRLILNKPRLEANCQRIQSLADHHGVVLRPHLKTCKSVDVAKIATAGRMSQITVSTLKEAEYFASQGYSDIMYAVGISPNKLAHVHRLQKAYDIDILLITDNVFAAQAIVAFADSEKAAFKVLIELDCGEHRGGVDGEGGSLVEIATVLSGSSAVQFKGVMTHGGHSYSCTDVTQLPAIAEAERQSVVKAAARLTRLEMPCEIISAGSTPTFLNAKSLQGLTEVRCGVYVFFDLAQYSKGVCKLSDIAVSVLATVIGHNHVGKTILTDAGAFAMSKDISANGLCPDAGYGYVCDPITLQRLDGLSITTVHQEHGSIPIDDDTWYQKLPIGAQIRILPNHACVTAAAYDNYIVVGNGGIEGTWARVNGW